MYTPGKYDTIIISEMQANMDELVKDPEFLRVMLGTISENIKHYKYRMERAEQVLRNYGVKDASRPITYALLERFERDVDTLTRMADSLKRVK